MMIIVWILISNWNSVAHSWQAPPCHVLLESLFMGRGVGPLSYFGDGTKLPIDVYRLPNGRIYAQEKANSQMRPAGAQRISDCNILPTRTWLEGLWGMTRECKGMALEDSQSFSPADSAAFPSAVLAAMQSTPNSGSYAEEIRLLKSGRLVERRPRFVGYAHSALVLLLFGALFWGLGANVALVVSRVRAKRRLAKGRCPICLYDLSGTPLLCPECGWNRPS